jgi:uncharacterized delta-60 repeat protein
MSPAVSAPGVLDTSFGGDGRVRTSFGSEAALASTVLIRPDSKIVEAGGAGDLKFAIAQYELGGTLDTSFGGDGRATAGFGGRECTGEETDAVLDALGRVVVAGSTGCRHGKFALARFMPDGTLDDSFGGDGKIVTAFGPECVSRAFGVAVQSDGKIVAAGARGFTCPNVKFALARYHDDGSLDVSFGDDGRITADFTPRWDIASDVAVEQNGGIVAAGTAAIERDHARFALARFLPDGTPDDSFDGDGRATTFFGQCPANGTTMGVGAGGRIVVGGWAGCISKFAIAAYSDDGSLDRSFGAGGRVTTRFPGVRCSDQIGDVAVQTDGKIVAAGYAVCAEDATTTFEFGLARYQPGGDLDTSFGDEGTVTTGFRGANALAHGVALQDDGRIVAAGLAGTRFALARYLAE